MKLCGLCEFRVKRGFCFGVVWGLGFKLRVEGFCCSVVYYGGVGCDWGCGFVWYEVGIWWNYWKIMVIYWGSEVRLVVY